MEKFIIQGETRLKGEIRVHGCKNAATPILAASLLTDEEVVLDNMPRIVDTDRMIELLRSIGARVDIKNDLSVSINAKDVKANDLSDDAVRSMRSSLLLLAPLLFRCEKFVLSEPGGCLLGNRPLDTHIRMFAEFGASIAPKIDSEGKLFLHCKKDSLRGKTIIMPEFSVTATENALMIAAISDGVTVIKNAAIEPHVMDLVKFLNSMGAKIEEKFGHTIKITGVKKLRGTRHHVIPDPLEAGTFFVAAALLGKDVLVRGMILDHLDSVLAKMNEAGVEFEAGASSLNDDYVKISAPRKLKSFRLQTMVYPGFPTDLQPQFSLLATQARGMSLIHDPLFDNRLEHLTSLSRMGAHVIKCDPHRAVVHGPTPLHGYEFKSPDIRAGTALLIAGMLAKGETIIHNAEIIDRGYETIDKRFNNLGAKIRRVSEA